MKKVITMLLAVCLVLGLSVGAFAANMTPTVDKDVVKAGERVKVTVSLNEDIEKVVTLNYKLYYNAALFTFDAENDYTSLCDGVEFEASEPDTDSKGSFVNISCMDTKTKGMNVKSGAIIELNFTAKANVAESSASFEIAFDNCMIKTDTGVDYPTHGAGPAATVTVKSAASSTSAYTAAVSGTPTIAVGENAVVNVTVSSAAESTFNAYDFTLSYDASVLEYKSVSLSGATVTKGTGTVRIQGYGADKVCATPITVTFTGKAGGESNVTLTDARFDKSDNAIGQDAPAAAITGSATITVKAEYDVTLPEGFTGVEKAESGKDYTFTAKNTNYTYTFNATMGGSEVTVVNNGDGTYTVKNVTGNLSIAVNKKTGKKFTVTLSGTASTKYGVADKATYGENFEFSASDLEPEKYNYLVTATVNGRKVTVNADDFMLAIMLPAFLLAMYEKDGLRRPVLYAGHDAEGEKNPRVHRRAESGMRA